MYKIVCDQTISRETYQRYQQGKDGGVDDRHNAEALEAIRDDPNGTKDRVNSKHEQKCQYEIASRGNKAQRANENKKGTQRGNNIDRLIFQIPACITN